MSPRKRQWNSICGEGDALGGQDDLRVSVFMQHESDEYNHSVVISSDSAEGQRIQANIIAEVKTCAYSEHETFGIRLAVEEALVNAIKHGNQSNPKKKIKIDYSVTDDEVRIRIEDEGEGFDPDTVPDPTSPELLERPCGRGLMLMRYYMSEISFIGRGNCVLMRKRRGEENSDE